MKTAEIIKIIEADGWFMVRHSGSHRQYKHIRKLGLVTIPIHRLSKDLSIGLEKSIFKQAQINIDKKH
ncbi:MAG: type II toxin-antitoxin system HicA family toxin [Saprospiraceae bacterium]|jgi:predicted RNA binding protein YcfA (HicA-like mRNA interferase family)|nr:type II toxin-antitoxin system HicA family toxin [Saprospiraceae bacterium]